MKFSILSSLNVHIRITSDEGLWHISFGFSKSTLTFKFTKAWNISQVSQENLVRSFLFLKTLNFGNLSGFSGDIKDVGMFDSLSLAFKILIESIKHHSFCQVLSFNRDFKGCIKKSSHPLAKFFQTSGFLAFSYQ